MATSRSLLDDEGQPSSGSPLQIGQIVHGKYRIERQIGRGGMGIVLAAAHLQLEQLVALKVMRRELVADDRALNRLLMEARAAARVRSEHVARVLDVGQLDNGSPFIVMEYLEGENLADLLDRQGALDVEQAASFLMQCCLALAEVHVAEMVHRDLKPGNIFITRLPDGSPSVKILDFGISKDMGAARERAATTSPQVLGSPFYMSPEQMRAEVVDERSDIWGLGAILFEMLTGRPPFLGDTLPAVYSAVLNEAPPPLASLRPGVPAGLDDVVQRCLEKNPGQRFCDVADLAEAIAPFAGAAARSAERVTRILTNPDAARKRQSLLPGGDGASGMRVSSTRLSLGSDSDRANVLSNAGEGMMGNSDWRDSDRPAVDGAPRAETVLEGDGRDRLGAAHESWRPSGPATSGEFSAMTATGARTGGALRRGMSKGWVKVLLGAAFAVALAVVFWPRHAPAPAGEEPTLAETPKVEPAPSAAAQPLVEPKVTPVVEHPPAVPKDAVEQRTEALRPPPQRAKPPVSVTPPAPPAPKPPVVAATPPRPAVTVEPKAEKVDEELPAPRPATSARPPAAHADDPWDPGSFGDRR
jgi:serine/threonine-protein kinase